MHKNTYIIINLKAHTYYVYDMTDLMPSNTIYNEQNNIEVNDNHPI